MYEKNLNIGYLLDFYGEILTERKRSVLDMYYNEDFSLAEISEEIGISRQGVRDIIKKTEEELIFLEERLGLSKKMELLEEKTDEIISLSKRLDAPCELSAALADLKALVEQ